MTGLWKNVVIADAADHTFDPPLDAIYVTVAADDGGTCTVYVNDTLTAIAHADLTLKLTLEVGHITRIVNTGNTLRYIGIRKLPASTFGAISDT